MRVWAHLLPLGLLACAKQAPDAVGAGLACIHAQVPKGEKVSATKAREVVDNCASQLDAWSRYSIEGSFKRRFDASDRQMTDAFSKHRAASQEYWLTHLSDEIEPSFSKL